MCKLATLERPNEASLYYIYNYNLLTVLEITHCNRSILACIFNNTAKPDNVWFKNVQMYYQFDLLVINNYSLIIEVHGRGIIVNDNIITLGNNNSCYIITRKHIITLIIQLIY